MAKGEVSSAFRAAVTGFIALSLAMGIASAQIVPPAFRDKVVFSGLTMPTAIAFSSDGRVFVAEKSGLIKVFASLSATTPTVFADLRLERLQLLGSRPPRTGSAPELPGDPLRLRPLRLRRTDRRNAAGLGTR